MCTGLSPLQGAESLVQCPWYTPAWVQSRPEGPGQDADLERGGHPREPQEEEPAAQSVPWPGQRRLRPRGLRGCCGPLPYLGGARRAAASFAPASAHLTATQFPFHPLMPRSPEGLGSRGLPHGVPLPGEAKVGTGAKRLQGPAVSGQEQGGHSCAEPRLRLHREGLTRGPTAAQLALPIPEQPHPCSPRRPVSCSTALPSGGRPLCQPSCRGGEDSPGTPCLQVLE